MNNNQKTKEKICSFYASDYHFEMISLPYISKSLENDEEIIILTQNDLEESINYLLSKINLNENKKKKILNINWKKEDNEKINKLIEIGRKGKSINVFIKGNEKYIENKNNKIDNIVKKVSNIKINVIDFYNMEEIGEKIHDIVTKYGKVLNTKGEKVI